MIAALEPVMAQHRLVFDTKPARDETNQRQITRLTEARGSLTHDDRVDVLSAACNYWEDRLHINVDDVIEKRRVQNHVDTINQWMSNDRIEGLLGSKVSGALRHHDPDWNKVQRPRVNTKRSQWGRRY